MNVIITAITNHGGIRVFTLAGADGAALPAYAAGAHIDLTLGNGLVRQYSLCCPQPGPDSYRIAVKREAASRGGSAWLHEQAQPGQLLRISAPRQAFGLVDSDHPPLLLAGGIGITPLLSMAHALARQGRSFALACFARDAGSLVFADELRRLDAACHLGLDGAATAATITALLARHARAEVYACGPAPFMAAVQGLATQRFGAAHYHQECFSVPLPASGERPFILHLKDGRNIAVAADRSALSCLQDAGVDLPSACEVGVCGSCRTALLSGQADHRDSYLSDDERAQGWFMPCVSRAHSEVLAPDLPA